MRIATLIWGMFVRALGWTASVGALLGALYSFLVLGFLFFITRNGPGPFELPPLGLFLSMTIILILGGGLVGGLIGLVFGPVGGLFCAVMTRVLFATPDARYPQAVKIMGALYGAVATVVGLWIISGFNISPPTGAVGNALLFYILPAVVGFGAGFFIGQRIADWYQESRTGATPAASSPGGSRIPAAT